MPLSQTQKDLLTENESSYTDGLSSAAASRRRAASDESSTTHNGNTVDPPINCPQWVCCLLPCIKNVPSMKLFRHIRPEDAEVLRSGTWVCYDAVSLVVGDVILLREGDIVPADCTVLSLGLNHVPVDGDATTSADGGGGGVGDLLVDISSVTGDTRPLTASIKNGMADAVSLYYGGRIVQGNAIAIVTAVGRNTMLARLIREKRWPPDVVLEGADESHPDDVGFALIPQKR